MDLQQDGKLALVSASTAGIGCATARTLATDGATVIVNGRRQEPVEDIPDVGWRRFFGVNILSGVRSSHLVPPGMRFANWRRVIFIASESAVQIPAEMIHHGMTKALQFAGAHASTPPR